jgi:hypothetical protein
MASIFYLRRAPDYGDPDNTTGDHPGYFLGVRENDGGIGVFLSPTNVPKDDPRQLSVFLNINEAIELATALDKAIERATPKNAERLLHQPRVRDD